MVLSDSNGPQLYLFEHEKRAKPKLMLDLMYCLVYKIPEDVFNRTNCLLVSLSGFDEYPSVHLSFQNEGIYLNWLNALRLRCFGCCLLSSVVPAKRTHFCRSTTIVFLTLANFR
ncbi:unnamed protein product [Gongylonema pulchrum]|uniref:PH domain-containing protein n=1 Tax=Gongylonema pulchrum TaxID=637853 RepID=A0A3P7NII6_9BILA|nr:unnamed protein product [Gongylonema pulchrum]VDN42574.1 unnamed protein product [Gongylonema pulchrum]